MKVAILGSASNSLQGVPWESPDIEFWAGASFYTHHQDRIENVDCWFELHNNIERLRPGWLGWAIETQRNCYVRDVHPEITSSVAYPLDKITGKFGRYLTSTVAYMLALAIYKSASDIFLFGVEMSYGDEYAYQRPCVEYMIGLAQGFGINVCIHENSPILKAERLYGYESVFGELGWVAPARENVVVIN